METATQDLENDHKYILRLINVMEKMVLTISTELSHLELVVRLIKNYADGFHHVKEEKLFFPMLIKKGFSKEQGPIAVMLHEHLEGRNFVKGMVEKIKAYKYGDASALTQVYENMQGYIDLLRAHIAKENNVLFRMADKSLTVEDQGAILKAFANMERTGYGEGQLQRFVTDIEGLEAIYLGEKTIVR